MGRIRKFYDNYTVFVIMAPSIVGLHWLWYKLQSNDKLIPKEDQQGFPYGRMLDAFKNSFLPKITGSKPE